MIPHPPIYLFEIRTHDIVLLLVIGAAWEFLVRLGLLYAVRCRPFCLKQKELALKQLRVDTERARNRGPTYFVETCKLERQVLVAEKELHVALQNRKTRGEQYETWVRRANWVLAAIVFCAYYQVPVIVLEGLEDLGIVENEVVYGVGSSYIDAARYTKALFFPISYVGMGMKISKWGLPSETAHASVGALVVLWASQVTVGMLMDAVDAYYC
jgi:hypothetical protein